MMMVCCDVVVHCHVLAEECLVKNEMKITAVSEEENDVKVDLLTVC